MLAFGETRGGTGRSHGNVNDLVVTKSVNDGLNNQHFVTDGAMLAFGETRGGTGRSHGDVNDLVVTESLNDGLSNQHFVTDGAVLAFGKTGFGTGRLNSFVDHLGMTKSIGNAVDIGVIAPRTTVICVTLLCASGDKHNGFVVMIQLSIQDFFTNHTDLIIQTVCLGAGNMTQSYNCFGALEMAITAYVICMTVFGASRMNYTDKYIGVTVSLNFAINITVTTTRASMSSIANFGTAGSSNYSLVVMTQRPF